MGTFTASLRSIGDVRSLPATIELSDGRLSIAAGDAEIGSWALTEIHLEPIPTGYRLAAEGDQILIELKDIDSFTKALESGRKRFPRRKSRPSDKAKTLTPAKAESSAIAAVQSFATPTATRGPAPTGVATAPKKKRGSGKDRPPPVAKPTRERGGAGKGVVDFVDGILDRGHKSLGAYLPDWVFSRGMFLGVLVLFALMIAFPGAASNLTLVIGLAVIVLGGVVYTDGMLASRWLPGRVTPAHVMLLGLSLVLVAILVGMISK
ncbi:MAG: hypothetical protein ACRDU9_09170 [Acidimicrobiia bacterium]